MSVARMPYFMASKDSKFQHDSGIGVPIIGAILSASTVALVVMFISYPLNVANKWLLSLFYKEAAIFYDPLDSFGLSLHAAFIAGMWISTFQIFKQAGTVKGYLNRKFNPDGSYVMDGSPIVLASEIILSLLLTISLFPILTIVMSILNLISN